MKRDLGLKNLVPAKKANRLTEVGKIHTLPQLMFLACQHVMQNEYCKMATVFSSVKYHVHKIFILKSF